MLAQKGVNGLLTLGLASFQRTKGLIKDIAHWFDPEKIQSTLSLEDAVSSWIPTSAFKL